MEGRSARWRGRALSRSHLCPETRKAIASFGNRQDSRGVGFMWGIVWSYINHGVVEGMVRVVCRGGANVDYRAAGAGGHGNLLVEEGEEGLALENIWGRRPIPSEGSRKEGLCRRVIAEGAEEETEGVCLVGRSAFNEGDTVPMDSVH